MKTAAAIVASAALLLAQTDRAAIHNVTAVRTWSLPGATRISIEVSGPFEFKYDRLQNPDRVYFDIKGAEPHIEGKRVWVKTLDDRLVQRIRVAETVPGVTRVVLDVTTAVDVSPSLLTNPHRLMIEMRRALAPVLPSEVASTPAMGHATAPSLTTEPAPTPVRPAAAMIVETPKVEAPRAEPRPDTAAVKSSSATRGATADSPKGETVKASSPARVPVADSAQETFKPPPLPSGLAGAPEIVQVDAALREPSKPEPVKAELPPTPAELARAARPASTGSISLTRALGLKLNRIVLDAGHGGHDQGTSGRKGLLEKDLVLDVTLRLGKLVEQGLGVEVVYTRSDDTFVPLEGRTAIANDKKADLFLSIHANSSSDPRVTGVETYYLSFTDSREALAVAQRENASSEKTIFELQDLAKKITLHEKLDESREFAARVQAALFAFSARSFPAQRNRGVKKNTFVVLIGAQMPSVLAEIGFVSNPQEEQLLKRPEYRQKLAESLYKGIAKYAESLSHFQLATNQ